MLATGVSNFSPNNSMMKARLRLKSISGEEQAMKNRLKRLELEEERTKKRIHDNKRKAQLMEEMNRFKGDQRQLQNYRYNELNSLHHSQRQRAQEFRMHNKRTISQNKQSIFKSNADTRVEVREMAKKIKETILNEKIRNQAENEKNFKDIYDRKQLAKHQRQMRSTSFNTSNSMSYGMRINQKKHEAD